MSTMSIAHAGHLPACGQPSHDQLAVGRSCTPSGRHSHVLMLNDTDQYNTALRAGISSALVDLAKPPSTPVDLFHKLFTPSGVLCYRDRGWHSDSGCSSVPSLYREFTLSFTQLYATYNLHLILLLVGKVSGLMGWPEHG